MAIILSNKALSVGLPIYEAKDKFVSNLEVEKAIADNSQYLVDTVGLPKTTVALVPEEYKEHLVSGLIAFNSLMQSAKLVTLRIELLVAKLRKGKLMAFGFPLHEKTYNQRVEVPEFDAGGPWRSVFDPFCSRWVRN